MSIIGASFILLSYILFPKSRKMSRKVLVYLSIADLGSAATWIWSTFITTQLSQPSLSCVVQGFLLQFFYLSSYVWTSCFAFHLYQLIWKQNTKVCVECLHAWWFGCSLLPVFGASPTSVTTISLVGGCPVWYVLYVCVRIARSQ